MAMTHAKFCIGHIVYHQLFYYRGVIIEGEEAWYHQVGNASPPKYKPWYHTLVHNAAHRTYVAEGNLFLDSNPVPVEHPELDAFFHAFCEGAYTALFVVH